MAGTSPSWADHPYAEFLGRVQKPTRYLGGEEQQIRKDPAGLACRFVLAFPDLYEVGMSHLGTRIIYDLVNAHADLACERAFSPWTDVEAELRGRGLPLCSLESHAPLREFDVVGLSLQYELSYTNVLLNLDLGQIPLRSADRSERDPIVIAGGPTATHPEPLAPFVDAFLVGEAEETLPELLRVVGRLRRAGATRDQVLAAIASLGGVYVPAFYAVEVDDRTGFEVVCGPSEAGREAHAPERIDRVWVRDLDAFPFPDRFPVPYSEAIFDRAAVEITRGCTEGCRFCQAGIIYRPVRERSPQSIVKSVLAGVDNAGYSDTSLTALSTADVSCIDPLIKELVPELIERKVDLGVASLRAYGLNEGLLDEIKRVGINGLTFAPEAGTQRMRDVINKNVSEEDILTSARRIFERGYDRMKMYFMIGLPTETDADVVGIAETGARVRALARELRRERMPQITCSVSQHVPKPHTPFQWAAMDTLEDLDGKVEVLRSLTRRYKVALKTHDVRESWLECLFARGDRRLAGALELAYQRGARFDGWRECFSFDRWLGALADAGIDPTIYTRTIPVGARLPWDHIDVGMEPGFLADEYRKAVRGRLSPPCGKPFGDKVHHTDLATATGDRRRLICYDCGVACDMTEMRNERVEALRELAARTEARLERATDAVAHDDAIVPLQRLVGRLGRSKLATDHARTHNAEAPYSRLRVFFGKRDTLRFFGHLDLMRLFPRMFRRAGIELAFRRGYNPVPRMTFTPALALGIAADEEVVDVDVIVARSSEDMAGLLSPAERIASAGQLLDRVRAVAPAGLELHDARLVEPNEYRLSQLVAAAQYSVELEPEQLTRLEQLVPERMAQESIIVERTSHKRRRKKQRGVTVREIDVRASLLEVTLEPAEHRMRFRLRHDSSSAGARPREVVEALLGERVPDLRFRRERLLARQGEAWVGLRELGPSLRPIRQRSQSAAS